MRIAAANLTKLGSISRHWHLPFDLLIAKVSRLIYLRRSSCVSQATGIMLISHGSVYLSTTSPVTAVFKDPRLAEQATANRSDFFTVLVDII